MVFIKTITVLFLLSFSYVSFCSDSFWNLCKIFGHIFRPFVPAEQELLTLSELPGKRVLDLSHTHAQQLKRVATGFEKDPSSFLRHMEGEFFPSHHDDGRIKLKGGSHIFKEKVLRHVTPQLERLVGGKEYLNQISKEFRNWQDTILEEMEYSRGLDLKDPIGRIFFALSLSKQDTLMPLPEAREDQIRRLIRYARPDLSLEILDRSLTEPDLDLLKKMGYDGGNVADRIFIALMLEKNGVFKMRKLGLNPYSNEDRLISHLLHIDSLRPPLIEANDVIKIIHPRWFFPKDAWSNMRAVARQGRAPLGGKAYFPASWGGEEITSAVGKVLKDPKSRILDQKTLANGDFEYLVIEGYAEQIVMTVIVRNTVISAFPSWRQDREARISRVKADFIDSQERLEDLVDHIRTKHPTIEPISPLEALDIFMRKTEMLKVKISNESLSIYQKYFDPEQIEMANDSFANIPSLNLPLACHATVFIALESKRILSEIGVKFEKIGNEN